MAAKLAVMVVPMLSPRISAVAMSKLIHPLKHSTMMMAIIAEELCTKQVRAVPINISSIVEKKPWLPSETMLFSASGYC